MTLDGQRTLVGSPMAGGVAITSSQRRDNDSLQEPDSEESERFQNSERQKIAQASAFLIIGLLFGFRGDAALMKRREKNGIDLLP